MKGERLYWVYPFMLDKQLRYLVWFENETDGVLVGAQRTFPVFSSLSSRKQGLGFCHLHWSTKQKILRDKFGVEWFKPSEMNNGRFD
jgi:hypothetical protein